MKYKIALLIITVLAGLFRFLDLQNNPPGFYSDEASYSYNAYSILKTGKDEYGRQMPTVFEAFGDYKLPVMLYSIAGSFALFSPSEAAARFPGALFGTLSVIALYLFTAKLFLVCSNNPEEKSSSRWIGIIAALLLAITPSHIFVSRGTWELTPALFFIIIGAYFLLISLNQLNLFNKLNAKGVIALLLSAISFIISLYAYNSARIFVPLFIMGIAALFYKQAKSLILNNKVSLIITLIVTVILILPILQTLTKPEVTQRAKYISIFYDQSVQAKLYDIIRADGGEPVSQTRVLHNKPVLYFMDFAQRYLSHFSPNFLWITGDTFEIFRVLGVGFLPLLTLPFLLYGFYKTLTTAQPWKKIILLWLAISPIASSFTIFTPSTSRAMNMVVPLTIISSFAVVVFLNRIRQKWGIAMQYIVLSTLVTLVIINGAYIFNRYFIATPEVVAEKWNDGFKETVEYVNKVQNRYDKVVISSSQAPSYIFYAWNLRYDPNKFQQEVQTNHQPDEHGLNFTSQFGKYYFTKDIKSEIAKKQPEERILFIGFPEEFKDYTRIIYSRNNKPAFIIKE